MKRAARLLAIAAVLAVASVTASSALAGSGPPIPAASNHHGGKLLGQILSHHRDKRGLHASGPSNGFGQLAYHSGGSVMHANTVIPVYWTGTPGQSCTSDLPCSYQSVINGFFSNVAGDAAANKTSNVYWSDTQYYDRASRRSANNYIAYNTKTGSPIVDQDAFPTKDTANCPTSGVCITDAQLQQELTKVTSGQPHGMGTIYFVFTPRNVNSCYSSSECSFSTYCAYHSSIGSGSSTILYANMPYADTNPSACDAGQHPNAAVNADADATINVTSHEQNETITDPLGNAWYDWAGYENGDKCAWIFGPVLGGSSGQQYDQRIGSGTYYLQGEYSDYSRGCVWQNK